MTVEIKEHVLQFKRPSGTSRGVLTTKESWFIILKKDEKIGIGECSLIQGLSPDAQPNFKQKLQHSADQYVKTGTLPDLTAWPAIKMGFETALLSFEANQWWELFPSPFTNGTDFIPINGLVWMGDKAYMKKQIAALLDAGFDCIKLKIGALDFNQELDLIKAIRNEFSVKDISIRVDANGAFSSEEALVKLNQLDALEIHSIEQPIAPNNNEEMAFLCQQSPLPIALDEALIGVYDSSKKRALLDEVKPQFIILKPSLLGGFQAAQEWIDMAENRNIGWWVTSALESNVGLNAIAQWTYKQATTMHQGLGTGSLFTNNIDLPLQVASGQLSLQTHQPWQFKL